MISNLLDNSTFHKLSFFHDKTEVKLRHPYWTDTIRILSETESSIEFERTTTSCRGYISINDDTLTVVWNGYGLEYLILDSITDNAVCFNVVQEKPNKIQFDLKKLGDSFSIEHCICIEDNSNKNSQVCYPSVNSVITSNLIVSPSLVLKSWTNDELSQCNLSGRESINQLNLVTALGTAVNLCFKDTVIINEKNFRKYDKIEISSPITWKNSSTDSKLLNPDDWSYLFISSSILTQIRSNISVIKMKNYVNIFDFLNTLKEKITHEE